MTAPEWKYGNRFEKPDLQRNALFAEMEYLHGKRYKPPIRGAIGTALMKGKQMGTIFPKTRSGLQDSYFGDEFGRIFIGEGIKRPPKRRKDDGKVKVKPPFFPPASPKWHSTPGDIYGTFTPEMEAFSPRLRRPAQGKIPARKNFVTSPGRKGGPGYANICLSPYPEHLKDLYDAGPKLYSKTYKAHMKKVTKPLLPPRPMKYFDPNPFRRAEGQVIRRVPHKKPVEIRVLFRPPGTPKRIGGCKAGCFETYPVHSTDKYLSPAEIAKFIPRSQKKKKGKEVLKVPFYPPICNITTPNFSIVNNKADLCTNSTNWETATTFTYPFIELAAK